MAVCFSSTKGIVKGNRNSSSPVTLFIIVCRDISKYICNMLRHLFTCKFIFKVQCVQLCVVRCGNSLPLELGVESQFLHMCSFLDSLFFTPFCTSLEIELGQQSFSVSDLYVSVMHEFQVKECEKAEISFLSD